MFPVTDSEKLGSFTEQTAKARRIGEGVPLEVGESAYLYGLNVFPVLLRIVGRSLT